MSPCAVSDSFAPDALAHLDAVYRFAVRLTQGNTSEAEDLVQDTFLQARRAWATFTPGTNCRAWLFTICRHRFLRVRTREARQVDWPDAEPAVEALASTAVFSAVEIADPERVFFDSFVDEEVTGAVDALPGPFREVVVLSDLEGLDYGEIARVLDVPIGTVKSRLFRGRRLLQQQLYAYALEMGYIRSTERQHG